MDLKDTDVVFNQLNRNCVKDMAVALSELKSLYAELKKEDKVSAEDYNNYIHVYRNITELYYIGSRKTLKPKEEMNNKKIDDDKLKELANIFHGNNLDDN